MDKQMEMNDKKIAAIIAEFTAERDAQNLLMLGLLEVAVDNIDNLLDIEYRDFCGEYLSSSDKPRLLKERADLGAAIASITHAAEARCSIAIQENGAMTRLLKDAQKAAENGAAILGFEGFDEMEEFNREVVRRIDAVLDGVIE